MKTSWWLSAVVLLTVAMGSLGLWLWPIADVRASLDGRSEIPAHGYVGSTTCKSCHQDHYRTWHDTYHRTMTQEATPKSVEGAFDGRVVTAWGGRIRPVHDAQGFAFEYLNEDGTVHHRYPVVRTVGSHRYQQYLTQVPGDASGQYRRLQMLWHNEDKRWVHMNGVFLYDDHQPFNQQVTTWNSNCIFCHNTGPEPGVTDYDEVLDHLAQGHPGSLTQLAHYDSKVAELGIACEACHGPGETHASLNRNPVRRYWLALSGRADPSIVNPRRLEPHRAAEICGQCHGQRQPVNEALTQTWLTTGPTFRPGERLADHVRLVWPEEPGPPGKPDLYRSRFWGDRTPRLSAYEMQGLSESKCYTEGKATCRTCHEAHGGDVNAMMRPEAKTNATCLSCHKNLAANVPEHTHHATASSGSLCVNCHMPELVYGVMETHRSHRIEIPDVRADRAAGRPDACTQCHLDQTSDWAARALDTWGTRGGMARGDNAHPALAASETLTPLASPLPSSVETADPAPEFWHQLLGGDTVQRAIAARTAGHAGRPLTRDSARRSLGALLAAMDDQYPAVRRFAWKSATTMATPAQVDLGPGFAAYDFTGDPLAREAIRVEAVRRLTATGIDGLPQAPQVAAWRQAGIARGGQINIGE